MAQFRCLQQRVTSDCSTTRPKQEVRAQLTSRQITMGLGMLVHLDDLMRSVRKVSSG
jgi:hypothetical protein